MLLLAFGLGGIALPVVHHIGHLDEIGSKASHEVALETASKDAGAHPCVLCSVRFAGLSPCEPEPLPAHRLRVADPLAPVAPLLSALRSHHERAPPVSA